MLEGTSGIRADVWKKVKPTFDLCICYPCAKKIGILAVTVITTASVVYFFWLQHDRIKQIKRMLEELPTTILSRLPNSPLEVKRERSDTPEFDSDDEKGKKADVSISPKSPVRCQDDLEPVSEND
jgi:hypothetical protein